MNISTLLEFENWYNFGFFCYVWGTQTGGLTQLIFGI